MTGVASACQAEGRGTGPGLGVVPREEEAPGGEGLPAGSRLQRTPTPPCILPVWPQGREAEISSGDDQVPTHCRPRIPAGVQPLWPQVSPSG